MSSEIQPKRVEHSAAGGKPNRFEPRPMPGHDVTANDAYEAMMFGHAIREAGYPKKVSQSADMKSGEPYEM